MAATKDSPAPVATRVAAPAVKTAAMKAAPVVQKSVVQKSAGAPAAAGGNGDGMGREVLVIAFIDLARFQIASRRVKDDALVEILEDYYSRLVDGLKPAGGRVVKFMGDGALVVFPADRLSQAARAVVMLKSEVDARFAKRSFATPLVARLHVGEVMAGALGPKGEKRYDVIGQVVNRAAAIRSSDGVSLTSDAFGRLDAKTQKLFKPKGDYYVPA